MRLDAIARPHVGEQDGMFAKQRPSAGDLVGRHAQFDIARECLHELGLGTV